MGVSSRENVRLFFLLALFVAVMLPVTARAQTTLVSNPTTLVFTPSADHNAVLADGRPAVDHYSFDVYTVGAAQPFQSTNIGKPAPASDGSIYYDFSGGVTSWPLPGGNYEARVSAVGPGGSGVSAVSNPFTFSSCSYALSGTSASLPSAGGGTQVSVTTGTSCTWTAVSNVSWIALSSPGGTGNGTVVATVAANGSTAARTGTLTVAGQAFTVSQQGASCSFTLSASGQSFPVTGGSGSVGITGGSGCAWTAASGASWVAVTPASGSGSGTASYTLGANTGAARSATLTIAGTAYTVSQAGVAAPSAPASPTPAAGATGVSTTPTLTWTASGATSYAVRFGTANPPAQVATGLTAASYAPAALAAGTTYYWQAVATNAFGSTSGPVWSFTTTASAPAPSGLPTPWRNQDVGSVGLSGSAMYSAGAFSVTGSGADIWGTADGFQFVYQPLSGNGQIVARMTGEQNTNYYAKAGIMLRESLTAGSAHVILDVMPNSTIEFMKRATAGGSTTQMATATQAPPAWLKLARNGTTVTASVSADGATWRTVGSTTVSMGTSTYIGLVVTSHNTGARNTASFDNVGVTALGTTGLPQPWLNQDVGSVGLSGSTSLVSGKFTVTGAGADIWGTTDSFQYAYRPLAADGMIVARLTGEQNTSGYAKAGVMLRAGLTASAAHVILNVIPNGSVEFMTRWAAGGSTAYLGGTTQAPPAWLRLVRAGSTVTASVSADGTTWRTVGSTTISWTGGYVGLAVTSHNTTLRNTSTFDNVTVK
jgi:regulation of enolase protein 1 (concanavalin A-like superfamily)